MHLITRRKAKLTCSLRMASLINHNSGWDSMEMPVNIRISVVENKRLCTFSSQDERMNFTGLTAHCTCTFPLKQKLQQLGEGRLLKARTASNNFFLELSQLEVKFIILVFRFVEDAGTPNELRQL